ncbi:hypothetical protein N6H18_11750 [Reichenbachiella agarivorans]|uniref:Uncharacterized protein n=1 Tax=Reichenbachiella agarivorans TaxID=2979464 RepID=A0ABY6CKI5_9BACT|nr:hypothetical protein [Reichenbachiella agarivorans]UXP31023.1 hypothetical protein N6H18_11750 [Reichenbachiella agarivorans]
MGSAKQALKVVIYEIGKERVEGKFSTGEEIIGGVWINRKSSYIAALSYELQ